MARVLFLLRDLKSFVEGCQLRLYSVDKSVGKLWDTIVKCDNTSNCSLYLPTDLSSSATTLKARPFTSILPGNR